METKNKQTLEDTRKEELDKIKEQMNTLAPEIQALPTKADQTEYVKAQLDGKYSREAIDMAMTELDAGQSVSSVVAGISLTIWEQKAPRPLPNFALSKDRLMTIRTDLINGTLALFYKAYGEVDALSGVSDVTMDDFNGTTSKVTQENFLPDTEYHGKAKLFNVSVNDFALKTALFVAVANSVYMELTRPFERLWNSLAYRKVADWTSKIDNVSRKQPLPVKYDIDKTFKSFEDLIVYLNTLMKQLRNANPENATLRKDWLPKGPNPFTADDNYEIGGEDVKLFATEQFKNDLQTNTQAHMLFPTLAELNDGQFETFIPTSTFSTYGNVTGIDEWTMFAIQPDAYMITMLYDNQKQITTPKLFDILHQYVKFGFAVDKSKIALNLHLKVDPTAKVDNNGDPIANQTK